MGSIIFALVIVLLILIYFFANRKSSRFNSSSSSKSSRSPKSYKYLIKLLNGDEKGAARLVESTQLKYPDRDQEWCIDKVINDLIRDRRG
jgi:hypothetical protein